MAIEMDAIEFSDCIDVPDLDTFLGGHVETQIYWCSLCDSKFRLECDLEAHVNEIHLERQCMYCNEQVADGEDLETHLQSHGDLFLFQCNVCNKSFFQSRSLQIHMKSHSVLKDHQVFQCGMCNAWFTHKSSLKRHILLHTYGKQFSCDQCGKCFTRQNMLHKHYNIHLTEAPFQCAQCGRAVRSKDSLLRHLRSHMKGVGFFKCCDCDRSFPRQDHLSLHWRQHHMERSLRPFKCRQCPAGFIRRSDLSRHLLSHGEKTLECPNCDARFQRANLLHIHQLRMHNAVKMFHCDVCGADFINTYEYKRHLLRHGTKVSQSEVHHDLGYKPLVNDYVEGAYFCTECSTTFMTEDSLYFHLLDHIAILSEIEMNAARSRDVSE